MGDRLLIGRHWIDGMIHRLSAVGLLGLLLPIIVIVKEGVRDE